MESMLYNTYFNRKLYIGKNGEIKNAPECEEEFGSIIENNLEQLTKIVTSSKFQTYWKVTKSKIEECRDCVYRHMCIDNRVPIKKDKEFYKFNTVCELKS